MAATFEAFANITTTTYAVLLHNQYKYFRMEGGKIERDATTVFGGIIRARLGAFASGALATVIPGEMYMSAGLAKGPTGALASGGEFYAIRRCSMPTQAGRSRKYSYTDYYSGTYAAPVPILTINGANDVYGRHGLRPIRHFSPPHLFPDDPLRNEHVDARWLCASHCRDGLLKGHRYPRRCCLDQYRDFRANHRRRA